MRYVSSKFLGYFAVAIKKYNVRHLLFLGVLLAAFPIHAFGQEATIVGTITDSSGAAAPNVKVTVTSIETSQVRTTTTSEGGDYLVSNLRIGHYDVRAENTGFKAAEQKGVLLQVNDRARIDFQLQVGAVVESVVVEANALRVQSDSSEISTVVTGKQMADIASNGRAFYNMLTLMPGASSDMPDYQTPVPVGGNATISINGQRNGHNIYLIDGGEADDRGGAGSMDVMPSQDAIAEFRALTSNYDAEYGLSSAGTMTLAVKSGQQQFHASAWEFLRNDALQAFNFFPNHNAAGVAVKPEFRFNVYGFNVGGPVDYKASQKKTFFFYNMEWRKVILGGNVNQPVPLTALYGGNFSVAGAPAIHTPCSNQLSAALALTYTGAGQTLSTAGGTGACTTADGATLRPFTGNTIPAALIASQATSLLTYGIFPASNAVNGAGQAVFSGGNNAPTNVREEIARVDHTFGSKFSMYGHWISEQIGQTIGTTMWSGDNVPTAANTFGNPSYSAVVHTVQTISPSLLNEIAFNYNGNRINILPFGKTTSPYTQVRVFSGPNKLNRPPAIQLAGSTGTNFTLNWTPWTNKADDYQVRDDVSWTHGSHQFKFGGSWAIYKKVQNLFANTEGGFQFNGLYSGNDFADFLLGLSNNYQEGGVQDYGYWNNVSWGGYFQDNWRATRKLTVNLGVRWDGAPHTYEANNRMGNFYPNLYNPNTPALFANANGTAISPLSPGLGVSPNPILAGTPFYLNGIGQPGQFGVPKGLVNNHWNAFGPRLGFAYDISGNGKTILRAGFGTMFERIQGNDMYNAGTNPPYAATVSNNNVLLADPNKSILTGATLVAPISVLSITGLDQNNYKPPTSMQYSIGLQRSVWGKSVLSVSYVGSRNYNANQVRDINLPPQNDLAGLIASGSNYNTLLPYAGFHNISMSSNVAESHYNSLQATLNGRVKSDLSFNFAYTYSKSIDPVGNGNSGGDLGAVSNPYSQLYDIGPSPLDRRQIFIATFIYDIPFLKHSESRAMKAAFGGWEISGVGTMETGIPVNITQGGTQGNNGLAQATNRPDVTGSVSYPKTVLSWFSQSAFSSPALGAWGNFPRNTVYGPGRDNWNVSLFKNFVFNETRGSMLQFRAETFNTFNHRQFNGIQGNHSDGRFGQVTSAFDPRTLQLGLKLIF